MTSKLKLLTIQLGLLCLTYTIARGLFLAFNFQSYQQVSLPDIVYAFLVGLRVDVAAICRINSVFILLSLLPFAFVTKPNYQRFLKALFLVSNVPFLILNVVDFEYHKFTGQRSSLSLLDMGGDISSQIGQLSFHYWYLVALAVLINFALYYFFPRAAPSQAPVVRKSIRVAGDLAALTVAVFLTIIGARGGWQSHPLTPARAAIGDNENLSQLALNSTYTMINGNHKCDGMSEVRYFATDEEIKQQFPARSRLTSEKSPRRDNVVIIIVESLSADYTGIGNPGHGYTPFLDSLARRGVYFKNGFADGRRSIDAPPAILAGLPHLRDETFYCAQFKQLHGIGSLLKKQGYNTSFFHGGHNGTMHFDDFSRRMGFDSYYGLNEYPRPQDSDGIWGIYDEPYLQYFARQLSQRPQPFASVIFTLSTHNPYKVPAQYETVLPTGELPIHRTVAYFDMALRKFFETAEKMPWYENTLFVITSDHIGPPNKITPRLIDNYRVPIVFFHPANKLPVVSPDKIVQHVDIGPSLLDYLGIDTDETLPFGHTIFDAAYTGLALGQKAGNFWIAEKNYYLEYRQDAPSKLFDLAKLDTPLSDKPEMKTQLEKKLKAYLQWFNNGLAKDNLYH
jgi:phosphoglycerol transferase MdoB-like AlkP superfamily enzyme